MTELHPEHSMEAGTTGFAIIKQVTWQAPVRLLCVWLHSYGVCLPLLPLDLLSLPLPARASARDKAGQLASS